MPYISSPDNTGPAILVIVFLCLIISVLVVCARLGTKLWLQRRLAMDDLIISISLAFSAVQSILVSKEISFGLGQRADAISSSDLDQQLRFQYAADILYLSSLVLAKISVLIFIMKLSPQKLFRILSISIAGSAVLWFVASVFSISFQCQLPAPWAWYENTRCIDRASLWTAIETMNGIFDLAIIILPTIILSNVQTSISKRITAISMFACRIIVVGMIAPKIYLLYQSLHSDDPIYNSLIPTILAQLIVSASIVCSSMQYLKPFLDSMESGLLRGDEGRRMGTADYGSGLSSRATPKFASHFTREVSAGRNNIMAMKRMSAHRQPSSYQARSRRDSDVESDNSESKIIQTRTFAVVSEPIDHQTPHAL